MPETIKDMLVSAENKMEADTEAMAEKVEKISHKVEDFVAEELKGLFEEMKQAS